MNGDLNEEQISNHSPLLLGRSLGLRTNVGKVQKGVLVALPRVSRVTEWVKKDILRGGSMSCPVLLTFLSPSYVAAYRILTGNETVTNR